MGIFRRLHTTFKAALVRHFRTREVLKVFRASHVQELRESPVNMWPQLKALQAQELASIKAGKLDVVNRKSWQWPYMPQTVNRLSVPVMKCYSADTDILSRRGWISVADVKEGDGLASVSPDGEFVWDLVTSMHSYRYRGKMCHFDNKGVDMLVTPNHRMYGRQVDKKLFEGVYGPVGFVQAADVAAFKRQANAYGFQVPISSKYWQGRLPTDGYTVRIKATEDEGPGAPIREYTVALSDFVALLGIWLAEGSTSGSMYGIDHDDPTPLYVQAIAAEASNKKVDWKAGPGGHQITIAQSKPEGRKKIEELLARTPFRWRSKPGLYACTSRALWEEFSPLGNKYTKRIPRWVKDLPTEFLRILVEWMVLGDGHVPSKQSASVRQKGGLETKFSYATASKQLADDFAEVLQKLGIGAYTYMPAPANKRPNGKAPKHEDAPFYIVHAASLKWVGLAPAKEVDYDGHVYCPTVPRFGTVLVRRNGKIAWCGNSLPYNLRRMSRTPVPRRAINLIKNAVCIQPWEVRPIEDVHIDDPDEQAARIKIAQHTLSHPNNEDSFQTLLEQGIEDFLIVGSLCWEMRFTPDPERPLKLWAVNTDSIRIFMAWQEDTPDMPRYAQMTGLKGERGAILFWDDDLLYMRDNPSTDNPFGIGKMEVAFSSLNDFLGVQKMAGMAGADQVHKCFPGDTEVLTRRGWIAWRNVKDDDEFATRSKDGRLQWQRALGFVREQHDGDMIRFNNRELSITVTPNHRMYGKCHTKDYKTNRRVVEPIGFVEARELYDITINRPGRGWRKGHSTVPPKAMYDFRIPTRTVWEDGVLPADLCGVGSHVFSWEDWAALLGIWIAEGSALQRGDNALPEYRIQIAQSKKANHRKYSKIEQLLKRMGVKYQAKHDRFIFCDYDIWKYLSTFGDSHSKRVPQWIKDAPVEIIRIFFDWAMLGDGTVRGRKRVYYTASTQLADDMQELFQKIGSCAAVCPYLDKGRPMLRVEEMLREEISIIPDGTRGKARLPQRIPFSGTVYCAMVPNGTLYCRENGYAFWSGNTWLWWEQPQNDSTYQIVRRHIQNELEGQAKVSLIGGAKKPDVIDINPVKPDDLLLPWQEMLIRMIANAFDMSAMSLNITNDVNRAVGQVLDDKDFRSAVVPMAKKLQLTITRKILHKKLGWTDLEFVFLNLDDPDLETKMDMWARLYSANAATPNSILQDLGKKPLESPFAEMTQFESMLVMAEAQAAIQNQSADKAAQRQITTQQKMMELTQPPASEGGEEEPPPEEGTPPASGGGSAPQSKVGPTLPPMKTPQFPISGSRWNAKAIASMSLEEIASKIQAGQLPPVKRLLRDMKAQEPTILDQMSEEVREFFEQLEEMQEEDNNEEPLPADIVKKWRIEQMKRMRQQSLEDVKRDYSNFMQEHGNSMGINPQDKKNVGKPGVPPRVHGV